MNIAEIYQELMTSPAASGVMERRAAPACPLSLFLFVEKPANRLGFRVQFASALLSEGAPLPQFRGLEFSRSRQSGQAVLILRPIGEAYKDVFVVLVDDIVTHASGQTSEAEAAAALLDRLGRWQTFLQNLRPEGLAPEEQRGLYGELWFLRHRLLPHIPADDAVHAWTGTARTVKDFQFPGGAVEMKTTTASTDPHLQINGARQLDDEGLNRLFLAYLALEPVQGSGETLPMMVSEVRALMHGSLTAGKRLEDKLREAGYLDVHAPRYEQPGYLQRESQVFQVAAGFPRLTERDLPAGVGDLHYRVSVAECRHHLAADVDLMALIQGQV